MSFYNPTEVVFDTFSKVLDEVLPNKRIFVVCSSRFSESASHKVFTRHNVIQRILIDKYISADEQRVAEKISDHVVVDVVVGIGGGSVMDMAKVIHGRQSPDTMLILIPTNFGSSSELTKWATIWDFHNYKKYSFVNRYADIAIYDLDLFKTLNAKQRIVGMLDSLSHSWESYWNVNSNPVSEQMAVRASQLVRDAIQYDLDGIAVDPMLLRVNMLSGFAFSGTETAIAHALSYPLTLRYEMPHGIASSITLGQIVQFCDKTRDTLWTSYWEDISESTAKHLSLRLRDYGVMKNDLPIIAYEALLNKRSRNFIQPITKQDILKMLEAIY